MRRVAANDCPEADHCIEPLRPGQGLRHERDFKRAWHAHDLDIFRRHAVLRQSLNAAAQQLAGDEFIEFGDDDPELQPRRIMRAFPKSM